MEDLDFNLDADLEAVEVPVKLARVRVRPVLVRVLVLTRLLRIERGVKELDEEVVVVVVLDDCDCCLKRDERVGLG